MAYEAKQINKLNLEGFIAGKGSDDFYADSANETVEKIQGIKKSERKSNSRINNRAHGI